MQGIGTPVSAAGQGGKAGSQASSLCNRSSTIVGNLASIEFTTTRNFHGVQCKNDPNIFCYVCADFVVKKNRRKINDRVKSMYVECFGTQISDDITEWTPSFICSACYAMCNRWHANKDKSKLLISVPARWSKPKSKKDCYFCQINVEGINQSTRCKIVYPNVSSMLKPEYTKQLFKNKDLTTDSVNTEYKDNDDGKINYTSEDEEDEEEEREVEDGDSDDDFIKEKKKDNTVPQKYTQAELNDLVRNLCLSKEAAEFLASDLKRRNLTTADTKVTTYRNREQNFRKYFSHNADSSLFYCSDVNGLMNEIKENVYRVQEWRLFIDSSKKSLKAVLLHNTNKFAAVPVAHSTVMKEQYPNISIVLEKLQYSKHRWQICGDLKILSMILGQQSGFTKYPCYLCEEQLLILDLQMSSTHLWLIHLRFFFLHYI